MATSDRHWFFKDKTLLPGEGHGPLAHEYDIVTLVVCGSLREDFSTALHLCKPWQLHYKPRGAKHTTATGPAGARMFLLGMAGGQRSALRLPTGPSLLGGGVPAARALREFLILAEAGRERGIDRNAAVRLVRCLEWSDARPRTDRPYWITEVHDRIHDDPSPHSSLGRLAEDFRVHSVYLARAYRKHYGASIGTIRRRVRIERAITRLLEDSASLADVALDLGYADQSHLSREFRRETGWSPGRFRTVVARCGRLRSAQEGPAFRVGEVRIVQDPGPAAGG